MNKQEEIKTDKEEIYICIENGCLSIDEIKKLLQCIREIEQNDTKRMIKIWINTPEKTVKEVENIIDSVNLELPYGWL